MKIKYLKTMLFFLLITLFCIVLVHNNSVKADEVVNHELYKYGDDYSVKSPSWEPYGSHYMQCEMYEDGYIRYTFDINRTYLKEGSLKIGVEYLADTWWPLVYGPDLTCYNFESESWVTIKKSMGWESNYIWKWYTLSNSENWVNNYGQIYFKIYASYYDNVIVRHTGVKWDNYILGSSSNLSAFNPTSNSIQLSWSKGLNSDFTIIRRKTDQFPNSPDDGYPVYDGIGETCVDDNDLSPGQKYYYSAWSGITQSGYEPIYTTTSSDDFEYTMPGKPNNFDSFSITATSIGLSWSKGDGSDFTIIRRQLIEYPNSPSDGDSVYFGNGTSLIDMGLSIGTNYYYRIWSYDGESGYYSLDFDQANFSTIGVPQVKTNNASDSGGSGVNLYCKLNGEIINDGGEACQVRFMMKKTVNGTWEYMNCSGDYGSGESFNEIVDYLDGSTEYFFMAGAKNCAGEHWGDICNFTTIPGPPVIDEIKSYYADGSTASNNKGFLLQGVDLENVYTASVIGDDADQVKFSYDFSGSDDDIEYIDVDGSDGWTSKIDFNILTRGMILNVSAYNNTYLWGKNRTYKPRIIPMEKWMGLYIDTVSFLSEMEFASMYIGELNSTPSEFDNYYLIYLFADFSSGCPANEHESPMCIEVPGGVPDHFGGDYGYSGGIGSSLLICSNGTIEVDGGFEAYVKVKNLSSGGIGANIYGDLNINDSDRINLSSMDINIHGFIRFPIFYVPLELCAIPAHAGIDISPHVNVTLHLEPTNNPEEGIIPLLGLKIKDDEGISGDVGCSIIAYFEADILIAQLYVEAGGDATLYFQTPPDENNSFFNDFLLKAWIGGRLRVLYWEAEVWCEYNWRWSDQDQSVILEKGDRSSEFSWNPMNRSYIYPDQKEYGYFAWNQGSSNGAIIENVFPYAEPCMATDTNLKSDNGVMIVWSHDNENNDPVKGMEIRYSRAFNDGFIEDPQTIPGTFNDSKLQMDPQIAYDVDGDIICVFVQTNSSITNQSSIDEVLNSTELAYCIWDNTIGTWSNIVNITGNQRIDLQPILSSNGNGDVVLVWTSDFDKNYETITDGLIFASFWNGTDWSDTIVIAENFSIVSSPHVSLNNDGSAICVFSGDYDNNVSTISDQNIYYVMFNSTAVGKITQFTFDYENKDTRPSVVHGSDGKDYIVWVKDKYKIQNETKIEDSTIFYKAISSTKAERVRIINGSVNNPFVLQPPATYGSLGKDTESPDFAVFWKSGAISEKLSFSEVHVNDTTRDSKAPFEESNGTHTDLINSSDKKLSDLYCCYTADGGIAVVTTERETLRNGSKNCDLSFLYSAPDNFPPYSPSDPSPVDGAVDIKNYVNLSWNGGDPDSGDIVYYDVYLSKNHSPILVVQNMTKTYYHVGFVDYSATYYWNIIAHDNHNLSSVSPLWSFTTENSPPTADAGGPYSGYVNEEISFDGSGSYDVDGEIFGYRWDFDGDDTYETEWLNESTTTFIYTSTGDYNVIFQVKDDAGAIDIDTTTADIIKKSENNDDDDDDDGGGGGSFSPPPAPTNSDPVADASKGEPYVGIVGENILFDGSESYDPDSDMITYEWDFGDDTTVTGEKITHSYSESGTYTVILTVEDELGATDTYETSAIISKANNPPTNPTIYGISNGTQDTEYMYSFSSTDKDNDMIQYRVEWGDESDINESGFLANGTDFSSNHLWTEAGIFTISVTATDNDTMSGTSSFEIYIDVLSVGDVGYLKDTDSDGTYDTFINKSTGEETEVSIQDSKYLIDDDGDKKWDYKYDEINGLKGYIDESKINIGYEYIALICIGLIIVTILFMYWKGKNKNIKK